MLENPVHLSKKYSAKNHEIQISVNKTRILGFMDFVGKGGKFGMPRVSIHGVSDLGGVRRAYTVRCESSSGIL